MGGRTTQCWQRQRHVTATDTRRLRGLTHDAERGRHAGGGAARGGGGGEAELGGGHGCELG
jgi:hypothetical protein